MRSARVAAVVGLASCGRISFESAAFTDSGADTVGIDTPAVATTYPQAVLASGPAKYYRLGELQDVALDASGNSAALQIFADSGGTIQHGVPGALGNDSDTALGLKAATSTGAVEGKAYIDSVNGPPEWGGDWTIEMFVEILQPPIGSSFGLLLCEDYNNHIAGQGNGFRTGVSGGPKLRFWNNEANGQTEITTDVVALNQWLDVVFVHQGNGLQIYVDNTLRASSTVDDYLPPTQRSDCGIGALHGMPSNVNIDELAIYAHALSPTDIDTHYRTSGR